MEDGVSHRGPGRPPHEPTNETRAKVLELTAKAVDICNIAEAIGISEPTLHAHYAEELEAARPQQNFPFPEFQEAGGGRLKRAHAGGRPPHVPTPALRENVEILVASGMRAWQIAAALGISEPTLAEHYEHELANGKAKKTAEVVLAQFKAATEGNVAAQKAWLGQSLAMEKGPASGQAPPSSGSAPLARLGKKEVAQHLAQEAATGKFATPAPPKLVVNNK